MKKNRHDFSGVGLVSHRAGTFSAEFSNDWKKKKIRAEYTKLAGDRGDGIQNVKCPACGAVECELDIEEYREYETERTVELCTKCREEFQAECGELLNSDVLDSLAFQKLFDWISRAQTDVKSSRRPVGLNEQTALILSGILGGEPWQSG